MATKKVSLVTATPPWEVSGSQSAVPEAPDAGVTLGQYKLLERISPEGSSPVFKALNQEIGREEALKLIASDIDEETRKRYLHEINLLGRLDIPGIITVYRCGTDSDENGRSWTYFSMPLVRGKNLDEHVRAENCSLPEKIRILERTAQIISFLHDSDILHKDIKPANVMVTETGEVRILDLGIARLTGEKEIEGEYLGTPAFSSPEQLQASLLTQATDVYSFAVMAYFILSGRHPYLDDLKAGYHTARESRREDREFKLDTYIPEISEELSELFNKALSIDPFKRPTMEELQKALNDSIAPATTLKISLVIGDDCRAERAILDRAIRNFQVYYGKGLEVETIYGYSDEADTVILMLWNSKVFLDDVFDDDSDILKYAFFKNGHDPLNPETTNLRETPLANKASNAGYTIIEFNDLAELERLYFRFLRRTLKSLYPDTRRIPQRSWNEAPYVGLNTFEYRHAPVFFGRTFALSRCLDFLRLQHAGDHNILVIHGSSGCGKSSLVRAGILPILCENNIYENVALWDYAIIEFNNKESSWQEQLRQSLSEKLGEATSEKGQEISQSEIDSWLSSTAYANGLKSKQCGLVFFFDQLESFFSHETEIEQRHYFDEFLMEISSRPDVIVIATIRSDFLPSIDSMPCLKEQTRNHGLFQLFPPNEYELNEIIRYPAIAAGLSFEDDPETGSGLEQSLCREAINSPEGLPLLEFLLSELYSLARADGLITWDEYKRLGGIEGALSRKAEQTLNELPEECRIALPRIILKLMSLTQEKNLIRNWMPLEEAAETSVHRNLIDHFVNNRLFTVTRRNGRAIVSVSHEALIRSWPRITELARFHQDFLNFRSHVNVPLKDWEKASKAEKPEYLLTGSLLRDGTHFWKVSPEFLTRREKEYLQESLLEKTRLDHARNKTRLRYAKAVIIISLLTVIITAIFSFVIYKQRHQQQAMLLEYNELLDQKRKLQEEIESSQSQLSKLKTEKSVIDRINRLRTANIKIQQLAAKLQKGSDKFSDSLKILNNIDTEMRSWEWGYLYTKALPDYKPLIGHNREVVSINPSNDSRYVVTASWDETAIVWDRLNGQPVQRLEDSKQYKDKKGNDVEYAIFSPNDEYIITATERGLVNIWPLSPGKTLSEPLERFYASYKPVRCLTFSPDGKFLLTCDDTGSIKSWNWEKRNFTSPIDSELHSRDNRCTKAVFSPTGSFFASCGWTTTPKTWYLSSTGQILKRSDYDDEKKQDKVVRDICFIDDQNLVSVSQDKTLVIWDLDSKKVVWKDKPNNDDITSVCYLKHQNLIATSSQNGSIIFKKPFSKKIEKHIKEYSDSVKYLSYIPKTNEILATCNDHSASIFEVNPKPKRTINHYHDFTVDDIKSFCLSDQPEYIYTLDSDGTIYKINPYNKTKELIHKTRYIIGDKEVTTFGYIKELDYFIIVVNNGVIIEFGNNKEMVHELDQLPVTAETSPDGINTAFLSEDKKLYLYKSNSDSSNTKQLLTEQTFSNLCWLSPNKLLLIDDNFYVYEYSLSTGLLEEVFQPLLKRHIYQMSASVTKLGPTCLTASRDNKVILTRLNELDQALEFDHHPRSDVFAAAISPDGMRLVTLCQRSFTPFLWNAASADELFQLDAMPDAAKMVDFSIDGNLVICMDKSNTLRVYYSSQSNAPANSSISTNN